MTQTLVFLDLDDTLFQSHRKCPPDVELHPAAYLRDGSAHSFMTPQQRALWHLFDDHALVIPTTARDLDALQRVRLEFRSWSILVYGALILMPGGIPDPHWARHMQACSATAVADLSPLLARLQDSIARHGLQARARLVGSDTLDFYLVAKYNHEYVADLDRLQQEVVAPWVQDHASHYRLHRNGNNLAVIPRSIGKEHAVRYLIGRLREEHGEVMSLGIGDSLVDAPFLAECDYCITPRGSQLFDATIACAHP